VRDLPDYFADVADMIVALPNRPDLRKSRMVAQKVERWRYVASAQLWMPWSDYAG
jgi:hypothetical protein